MPLIIKAAKEKGKPQGKVLQDFKIKGFGFSFAEFKSQIVNLFRSAAIGIGIGILPGIGGGTSNIWPIQRQRINPKHLKNLVQALLMALLPPKLPITLQSEVHWCH